MNRFVTWPFDNMCSKFDIPKADRNDGRTEVLYASYDGCGYEGDALVVVRSLGRLWVVKASHCSCSDIEGCWAPQPFNVEAGKQWRHVDHLDWHDFLESMTHEPS